MITVEEAAAALNNSQYREEGSPELFGQMQKAGLVAIYGGSDDLAYLAGAENDEIGAGHGSKRRELVRFTPQGLLVNKSRDEDCPYFKELEKKAVPVFSHWSQDGFSWTYSTEIPHKTFIVMEDDETYCRGIVLALADVPVLP